MPTGHTAIAQLCFRVKCTVLLSPSPNNLCIFSKAHTGQSLFVYCWSGEQRDL